jgi:antirestriction protein ArdC
MLAPALDHLGRPAQIYVHLAVIQHAGGQMIGDMAAQRMPGFSGQSWLTFRQALGLGGQLRKGERGTTVVYANRFTPGLMAPRTRHARSAQRCRAGRR